MPRVTTGAELANADDGADLRDRIGGKGLGLVRLLRLHLDVPPFFVIETDGTSPDGQISDGLRAAVRAALARVSGPVAVRSSAVAEDGETASFAGQLESYLGIDGEENVLEAIRKCWASGDTERVRAYRKMHDIAETPVAVVVQQMIDPIAAGVMFSTEPDNPEALLISAGRGLGEGVVQS